MREERQSSSGDDPPCVSNSREITRETADERLEERLILDLTFGQKLAIGCGHIVNDITASIWFSYYLMYSQEVIGFSGNAAAGLMLLGQIVDAISTPLVGYEADQGWGDQDYWLCRSGFGRYKSWHLLGVIMAVISFPFIFSPPVGYSGTSEIAKVIYYIPFIIVYEMSWAAVQISHLALIPKMNPDMSVRTEILSIRYIFMVLANIIVFGITWNAVGMGKNCVIDKTDVSTFQNLGLIAMSVGVVTAIIFYISTKEHHDDKVKEAVGLWEAREESRRKRQRRGVRDPSGERSNLLGNSNEENTQGILKSSSISASFSSAPVRSKRTLSTKYLNPEQDKMTASDWVKLPQFYMVGAVYITGRLIINVPQAFLPLYLQESLHLSCSTVATIPMTYFMFGFVVAFFMKIMNKHLGRQLTFGFGILLNLAGASIIIWGDWSPGSFLCHTGIYGVFALLGGGASAGMITGLSITADMIGNNVESGAFVYGFMSFCDKLSCGVTIMAINLFCPTILPGESSKMLEDFYKKVIAYSCVGCSCLAIFGLTGLTILIALNNRKIRRMESEHSSSPQREYQAI